jgi:nitroreductase
MELSTAVLHRHSCRAFKPDEVPHDVIKEILDLASHSPSYMNTQPWEVAVVTGQKLADINRSRAEFALSNRPGKADVSQPAPWPEVPQERARRFNSARRAFLGLEDPEAEKNWHLINSQFFGAPCALYLFIDRMLGEWSVFDLGLFTQTLLLAAESKGLGTCVQASVVRYADYIRETLGLAHSKRLIIGVAVGYPDTSARINEWRSDRIDMAELVTWHR